MLDQAELVGRLQASLPGSKALLGRAPRLIEQLGRDNEAGGGGDRAVAAQLQLAVAIWQQGENFRALGRDEDYKASICRAAIAFDRASRLAQGPSRGKAMIAKSLQMLGALKFKGALHSDSHAGAFSKESAFASLREWSSFPNTKPASREQLSATWTPAQIDPEADHARIGRTTWPWTLVKRRLMPLW